MFFPTVLNEGQLNEILKINQEAKKYGLIITLEDVKEIMQLRNSILESCGRIELDCQVTKDFLQQFCASPYVNQDNYIQTINELHEIFYYLKNETEDKIGDEELIFKIRDLFDNFCAGSVELLKSALDDFVESFKKESQRNVI